MRNLHVASALIIKEGKILLGERTYDDIGPVWIAPGGRLDEGEGLEEGLRREVYEEIGVKKLIIHELIGEFPGVFDDEQGRDTVFVFLVSITEEPRLMEPEKFRTWQWFSYDEIPPNLPDPELNREIFKKAFARMEGVESDMNEN